eukprot:m.8431 g.8431  ORF g.8431 m.8431 type:complete len:92 (+) comp3890_c0_seq1:210-485(+)
MSSWFGGGGTSNAQQEKEVMAMLQRKQMEDFIYMFNNLTSKCFDTCVNEFNKRTLQPQEKTCAEHCMNKFFKVSERVGTRYAEYQKMQNNM